MVITFVFDLTRNLQVDQEQFVLLSARAGPAVTVDLGKCHASSVVRR